MCSCKSLDRPAKQARMLTEGVWFEIFLSCPGDLLAIALSWLSPEKGGQGYPLVNVRGVGENHEVVKHGKFCCSVTKLCLTLWDHMDCSMPGFPVLHYLLEFALTHVHWVSDAKHLCIVCWKPTALFIWVYYCVIVWIISLKSPPRFYIMFTSSL